MKIVDATTPLRIKVTHTEAGACTEETHVPLYRIKGGSRKFMGWALRNGSLRGVIEIRFLETDEMQLVRRASHA